jgi:phage FluMu protein Com
MSKHRSSRLVPLEIRQEGQTLESPDEVRYHKQTEQLESELDLEMECPRCNEIMELRSNFDELLYSCESCSFLLKCI